MALMIPPIASPVAKYSSIKSCLLLVIPLTRGTLEDEIATRNALGLLGTQCQVAKSEVKVNIVSDCTDTIVHLCTLRFTSTSTWMASNLLWT